MNRRSPVFKSIVWVVIAAVSFSQNAFALTPRELLAQAFASFDEEDIRRAGSAEPLEELIRFGTANQTEVERQNVIQDVQNLNFNLTTQNGDILNYVNNTLSKITRPDGTLLKDIVQDAQGYITGANLRLADGAVQVFDNGRVIAGQTPDGGQVFYSSQTGRVEKTISRDGMESAYSYVVDSEGRVLQTILDNNRLTTNYDSQNKLKEILDKETGRKTVLESGMIERIFIPGQGSLVFSKSEKESGFEVLFSHFEDLDGHKIYFRPDWTVQKIELPQGYRLISYSFDEAGPNIKDAVILDAQGQRFTYRNKKLREYLDASGRLTRFFYKENSIEVTVDGFRTVYDLQFTPVKITDLGTGITATFHTEGILKGLKHSEYSSQGVLKAVYEYAQKTDGTFSVEKWQVPNALKNDFSITSLQPVPLSVSPVFKSQILFPGDQISPVPAFCYIDVLSGPARVLGLDLRSGGSQSYATLNGITRSLSLGLQKDVLYNVEIRWESNKFNVYIYDDRATRPALATFSFLNGASNPIYTARSTGTFLSLDFAGSTPGFFRPTVHTAPSAFYSASQQYRAYFKIDHPSPNLIFNVFQKNLSNLSEIRNFQFQYLNGRWSAPGQSAPQELLPNVDYIGEVRIENLKANLYVYEKGSTRPDGPILSADIPPNFSVQLNSMLINAKGYGQHLLTPTAPSLTSCQAKIFSFQDKLDLFNNRSLRIVSPEILDSAAPFKTAVYEANGSIREITMKNGSKVFFENGLLKKVLNEQGLETQFNFIESSLGNLLGTSLVEGGVESTYGAHGKLSSVRAGELTIHYKDLDNQIDYIEQKDGAELHDLVFDDAGQICGAAVYLPDGRIRVYENRHLVRTLEADRSALFFVNDRLSKMITPDAIAYHFEYHSDRIEAVPDIPMPTAQVQRIVYDPDFNLRHLVLQDQKIMMPDEINFLSKATRYFNDDGSLQKMIIFPSENNVHTLEIFYEADKIRRIKKNGALTFTYSYETVNGLEQTVIHDLEERATKTYEAGLLIKNFDNETSVLSSYEYALVGASGEQRVEKVTVSRLGKNLHHYDYQYQNDRTLVADEVGVVRTYDANRKLIFLDKENKRYAYTYHVQSSGPEIVQERLIQKSLSDASAVYYDVWGQIERITLSNGLQVTDVRADSNRRIQSAKVVLPDGRTLLFDENHLLEEISPDDSHWVYQNGRLASVAEADGLQFSLNYDLSLANVISAIRLDLGNEVLNYDAEGHLKSLKLETIPAPQSVLSQVVNSYSGGVNSAWSYDGDLNTAQTGGLGESLVCTHTLASPGVITGFTYRMSAGASSSGSSNNGTTAYSFIETQDTAGVWTRVLGTELYQSHSNGGGGGSTAFANTGNPQTLTVNIPNVIAVRAQAGASGYSNGGGSAGGSSAIFEIQFTLADQSMFQFSENQGNLIFNNSLGTINFNSQGDLQAGSPDAARSSAQSLEGKIQRLAVMPYFSKINEVLPEGHVSWVQAIRDSLLDSGEIVGQEYSTDGILETQIKADETVTLFESGKPSQVLDRQGRTVMRYLYDAEGNPTRVYLKNARDTLPDQIKKAQEEIEFQRASQLKKLAEERSLATQQIYAQAETQRQLLTAQLESLEAQQAQVQSADAKGKQARAQKADALSQMQSGLNELIGTLTQVSRNEADAYAQLDLQVKNFSDQIHQNAQNALNALDRERQSLEREILRQEVSPIVYHYYRTILGRDPNSQEYESWIGQLSFQQTNILSEANILSGIPLTQALRNSLSNSQELQDRQAYVQTIKNNVTQEIQNYLNLADTQKIAFAQSLGLSPQEIMPLSQGDAQKIISWLGSRSLHFGQSAFISLESLLDQKDISYSRTDIAQKAILIDILAGVISPLDDGDLVLSVFSLNKVAGLYGLDLSGANLSWSDLKNVMDEGKVEIGDQVSEQLTPGSSLRFNGVNSSIKLADSDDWHFGTGNFTIDTWIKFNSINEFNRIFEIGNYNSGGLAAHYWNGGTLFVYTGDGTNGFGIPWSPQANTWYHLAITREGTSFRVFANGIQIGTTKTNVTNFSNTAQGITIGSWTNQNNHLLNGSFDEFRITKGAALWNQNFAPEAIRHSATTNTVLLLHGTLDESARPHAVTIQNVTTSSSDFATQIKTIIHTPIITHAPADLNLSNKTPAQIQDIIQNPGKYSGRVIAHISGNHYVIVTSMTDTTVTYIDPGIGKDKENETITVTKEGFLKVWQGNVTLEQAKIQTLPNFQQKILSASQAQNVRGAFWGSVLGLIGSVLVWIPTLNGFGLALTAISAAISVIEGDWVSAISSIVTFGMGGGLFKDIFKGVTGALGVLGEAIHSTAVFIKDVFMFVAGFTNTIANSIGGFFQGALGISSKVVAEIAKGAVAFGISTGVSMGFEALGIRSDIAGLIGSLTAGAVIGGSKLESTVKIGEQTHVLVSQAQNIKSSLQTVLTIGQVGRLGMELGLDPILTNIVGLSLGVIQGNLITSPGSPLEFAFSNVRPELSISLQRYGLDRLSPSIGVSPIAGQFLGNSALNILNTAWQGGVSVGQNIIQSINQSLSQEIVKYGINFAGNSHPIFGSLLSQDIQRSIEQSIGKQGLFRSVFNVLGRTSRNLFQGVSAAGQSIQSFGTLIQQKGLAGALGQTFSSFFGKNSVEEILSQGGMVQSLQNAPRRQVTLANGQTAQEAVLSPNAGIYFDSQGSLIGVRDEGLIRIGSFGYDSNADIVMEEGYAYSELGDQNQLSAQFENYQPVRIEVRDNLNQQVVEMTPTAGQNISFQNGGLSNAALSIGVAGLSFIFKSGVAEAAEVAVSGSISSLLNKRHVFGNGFENKITPENTREPLMNSYVWDLSFEDELIDLLRTVVVNLYEQTMLLGNAIDWLTENLSPDAQDLINIIQTGGQPLLNILNDPNSSLLMPPSLRTWFLAWQTWYQSGTSGIGNDLVQDVIDAMKAHAYQDAIAFVHSGAGAPTLTAIDRMGYDVQTVIMYESPNLNYNQNFTNPNLRRIIHVQGTATVFNGDAPVPFLGDAHFGGVDNINIHIDGAFHNDFSYDPAVWDKQIAEELQRQTEPDRVGHPLDGQRRLAKLRQDQERNRKVNLFMRRLYGKALTDQSTPGDLDTFFRALQIDGVAKFENNIWKIDLELFNG